MLTLISLTLLQMGTLKAIPFSPSYGWQFSLNDYQRKEFEFSTEVQDITGTLHFVSSCSRGMFDAPNHDLQLLKTKYQLTSMNGITRLGDLKIFCLKGHTAITSTRLWQMLGYRGKPQLMRANSETLKTPLFSKDLKRIVLPIPDYFSVQLKMHNTQAILEEVDNNLKVCIRQSKRYRCLVKDQSFALNVNTPFTIEITNNDIGKSVFYFIDIKGNTLAAWSD